MFNFVMIACLSVAVGFSKALGLGLIGTVLLGSVAIAGVEVAWAWFGGEG